MSQIETIMLFALGFILAALIAMFLGRGLWNYGVKIGQRRMQKLSPLSITEVQADRDRLRAEYAVMTRKLELRLDDLKDRMAEQMAEVSRNKTRIEDLHGEIDERDQLLAERESESANLKAKFEPLETELAARTASIQQLKEQLRNKSEQSENAQRELVQLRLQLEEKEGTIAELEAKAAAAEHQTEVERAITDKVAHLSKLTETIQEHKNNLNSQQEEIRSIESSLKDAEDKVGQPAIAKNTKQLADNAGALEKSMSEAEEEAQKLHNELAELDKVWDARSKKDAAPKKPAAKAAGSAKPRKSATVTPLHKPDPAAAKKDAASGPADESASEGKKIAPESVAAKMLAASKAASDTKQKADKADAKTAKAGKDKTAEEDVAETTAAKNGTNGASNGAGGTKVQKVLSLAQRIRALQNEITN